MRVFISWSGERSKVLARALKEWLPLVLYNVVPWMSEVDIAAGERWEIEIAKELEGANFGVTCVTRDNVDAPWMLFEAGALAKSLQLGRVVPLLMDHDFKDISGPLTKFQAKKTDKAGFSDVVKSINQVANHAVPEANATRLFELLWPDLETKIAAIPKPTGSQKQSRPANDVMEELVSGVRALETRIREIDESPRPSRTRKMRMHPMMIEDMMHMSGEPADPVGILLAASMVREDAPWLYELAMEVYRAVKSGDAESIEAESTRLRRFADTMMHGPWMREFADKEGHMFAMEFPRMLDHMLRRTLDRKRAAEAKGPPSLKRRVTPENTPE